MTAPLVRTLPQPGKAKSRQVLAALARGSAGESPDGVASFYGTVGLEDRWHEARAAREYLYVDNAFLDAGRGTHFRIGRNALQTLSERPDWGRLRALGIEIKPWRANGRNVVLVEQSDYFMREIAGWEGGLDGWKAWALSEIAKATGRPIVVRGWDRDKIALGKTLRADLENACAVVGYTSAALNEAVLFGVPVFPMWPCPALEMGTDDLRLIEHPRRPDREEWAARLANSQWTLEEMADGVPWRTTG